MRVKHLKEGEQVWLKAWVDHKLVCCSCGRTHKIRVSPGGTGVWLGIWDDDKATRRERVKILGKEATKTIMVGTEDV